MTMNIEMDMESKYQCRYEIPVGRSGLRAFPVTHRLDGRAMPYTDGGVAAWAHIGIGNLEVLNWRILDVNGRVLIHGTEQNHARTLSGYRDMLRRALRHVRAYGAVRVWHRDRRNVRPSPSPWVRHLVPQCTISTL